MREVRYRSATLEANSAVRPRKARGGAARTQHEKPLFAGFGLHSRPRETSEYVLTCGCAVIWA